MFEVFNGQKYTETLAIFKQRAEEVFPNLSPEAQADIAVKLFDLYKKDEITMAIQNYKQANIKEIHNGR